jgi:hypothetical protein
LVTVAEVARALPRHWDGHRLLRFLTGLALLAVAFAAPFLAARGFAVPHQDAPAAPPAAVRTVTDVSAAPAADAVPVTAAAPAAAAADARPAVDAAPVADAADTAHAVPAAPRVAVPLRDGDPQAVPPAGRAVILLAGAALVAHGSRAPPLR